MVQACQKQIRLRVQQNRIREQLCRYLESFPVLLILDGLEVIQETEKPDDTLYVHMKAAYQELSKFMAIYAIKPVPQPSMCQDNWRAPTFF